MMQVNASNAMNAKGQSGHPVGVSEPIASGLANRNPSRQEIRKRVALIQDAALRFLTHADRLEISSV